MNYVGLFALANYDVDRFNVSMDELLLTHLLKSLGQLNADKEHSLETKVVLAEFEQLLDIGPHHGHGQTVVLLLLSEPNALWKSNYIPGYTTALSVSYFLL